MAFKKETKTPSQSAKSAATTTTTTSTSGPMNMSGVGAGTSTPSQAAQNAVQGLGGQQTSIQTNLPGGKTVNVDAQGNPIAYYGTDYAQNLFANYAAKDAKTNISNVQKKLMAIGAYPKGYSPTLGIYTQTDVDALNKITIIGEQIKEPDINNLFKKIQENPTYLNLVKTGGQTSGATKSLTSAQEAASVLTDQFLNVFNTKPTAAEVKAYTNALNAREKTSKTALSSQERQDILMNAMNQKAALVSKSALLGDTKAVDEGAFGRTVRSLRDAYFSNGVKTTDANLYKQAATAMRSQDAYNNVLSTIQINAKAMMPALGQYIDMGKSVRDILNSHINTYSNIFGVSPDQVDLQDLAFVANGTNLMSTTDMVKSLWNTNPKIKETQYYKDIMANDARSLLNMIGVG